MQRELKKYVELLLKDEEFSDFPVNYKKNGDVEFVVVKEEDRQKRIDWIEKKKEKYNHPDWNHAEMMRYLHPTKQTLCQKCFTYKSVYYEYVGKNLAKKYPFFDFGVSIFDYYNEYSDIINKEFNVNSLEELKVKIVNNSKGGKLSPGAMSNFPDRLDGFHSYNLCCRAKADRGRHEDNMHKYNKDRRVYEYASDGNIRAANIEMKAARFNGLSADHIGPISLGFRHEPYLLQPLTRAENSAKNNRLRVEDVIKLTKIETSGYEVVNEYQKKIWSDFKMNNKFTSDSVKNLQKELIQNQRNYYFILSRLYDSVLDDILSDKLWSFDYDFETDDNGYVLAQRERNITKAGSDEKERALRILKDSIEGFHSGEGRKIKPTLNDSQIKSIKDIKKYKDIIKLLSH